jgi:hypothetical protein
MTKNSIKYFLMTSAVCNYVIYLELWEYDSVVWLFGSYFSKLINFTFITFAVNLTLAVRKVDCFYSDDQDAFIVSSRHILWNSWYIDVDAVLVAEL